MAALAIILFSFLVVEFGTSETVFAFLFLLFIRPRRLYTYKLQKLARRQDMQHIRKKDTCTLHYAPVALLACSADFPLVSGIASHRIHVRLLALACYHYHAKVISTATKHTQHLAQAASSPQDCSQVSRTSVLQKQIISHQPLPSCFSSRHWANSHAWLTPFCSWLLFPVSSCDTSFSKQQP